MTRAVFVAGFLNDCLDGVAVFLRAYGGWLYNLYILIPTLYRDLNYKFTSLTPNKRKTKDLPRAPINRSKLRRRERRGKRKGLNRHLILPAVLYVAFIGISAVLLGSGKTHTFTGGCITSRTIPFSLTEASSCGRFSRCWPY